MGKITECRSTLGRLSTTQVTVDLPKSSGTALEIDLRVNELACAISIYATDPFYWTISETAAAAATRLSSDATRCKFPAGYWQFPIVGNTENLYIISSSDNVVTDGITYTLVEAD